MTLPARTGLIVAGCSCTCSRCQPCARRVDAQRTRARLGQLNISLLGARLRYRGAEHLVELNNQGGSPKFRRASKASATFSSFAEIRPCFTAACSFASARNCPTFCRRYLISRSIFAAARIQSLTEGHCFFGRGSGRCSILAAPLARPRVPIAVSRLQSCVSTSACGTDRPSRVDKRHLSGGGA